MANHPLAGIPLFEDLSEEELGELEALLSPRAFPDRRPIFWLGDHGDEFFLVRKGHVDISCQDEAGKDVLLTTLGPGHFFGEISLLDGGPRTASAFTHGPVVLSCLSREQFLKFLHAHPEAAIHMLTVLGRRLRETNEMVRGIRNVNDAVDRQRTRWQVMAERIATFTATQWFVGLNLAFFLLWVGLNLALRHWKKDFDGTHFDLLSLIITAEAFFITLFVLISQNQQNERDRIRADLEYHVNIKAHQEVMQLQQKVDRLADAIKKGDGA
jgi:CRP/FNR family cyclic AMP-dependent transcriptional regulator